MTVHSFGSGRSRTISSDCAGGRAGTTFSIRDRTAERTRLTLTGKLGDIGWLVLAGAGGVCCLILPPYLSADGLSQPAYGWPLIPWFALAIANLKFVVSAVCFFVFGLAIGFAHAARWRLNALAAIGLPLVIHVAHIVNDGIHDPTSHNLFPFEIVLLLLVSLPALAGSFLGSRTKGWLKKAGARA